MSKKKQTEFQSLFADPPKTLDDHPFYGLRLTDEQKELRDAIWSPDIDAVIVDSVAGSGKTLISVATALLLCQYNLFTNIIYVAAGGVYESKQGLLPGSLSEKSEPLFTPLRQAVLSLNMDPSRVIYSGEDISALKEGTAFIEARTDSYSRGVNFGSRNEKVIVIVDEAQNLDLHAMRTIVTRINTGSKLIAIGEQKQCDLKYSQDSGFPRLISVFSQVPWCKVINLTKNFRGRVSQLGDTL